ncbi:TIGR01906 family membrane protein [Clostridium butyricum]|uniref:TIGR01906 family membrane protein n=1 Tax=Clostridium butyricum TaxID=1492 RepID=UPI00374E9ECC
MNYKNKKHHKYMHILFSLTLSLFIIFISVKITLIFKPLYYFDIEYLNISEQSNYSKDEIIKNYSYIINYLLSFNSQEFQLPSIAYSRFAQIHFKDVKGIFKYIDILLALTGIISLIGLTINIRYKNYYFLKVTSSILIFTLTSILIAFAISFDACFVLFHKIFFRNDYWVFDSSIDPIIDILPKEFFLHTALFLIFLIILSIIVLIFFDKKLINKRQV